jgi:Fe2+ or Zn2+ uptake regulation protein
MILQITCNKKALMLAPEAITEIFQTPGRRMTSQRRLLLKVLAESHGHLDAEAIYALAKEKDPNISLATVYRNLKVLKEAGIVQERLLDREGQKHHYEVAAEAHYHFTCVECGQVIEFESPLIEQASEELAQRLNLEIIHTRVHLEGYCVNCQKEIPSSEEN